MKSESADDRDNKAVVKKTNPAGLDPAGQKNSIASKSDGEPSQKKRRRRRGRYHKNQDRQATTAETQQSQTPGRPKNKQPHNGPFGDQSAPRTRPVYAALDLGTNNCRLLVAIPNGQSFRVIDAFSRIVRLGEGVGTSNRLADEAMDRAIGALKVCAGKLNERAIKKFRLIATEACRVAENGEIFLERVRKEAGLELEIVNRKTEARLAVTGCTSLIDRRSDGVILFDIGGGSSELVWLDLKRRKFQPNRISQNIRAWTSLPVGVVNISERHGGVTVTPDSFEGMVQEVMKLLDDFPQNEALKKMVAGGRVHMLGTSGTVTTLAGVHLGLERYDRRKVDGLWLSDNDVTSMTQKLLSMSFEERQANACIGKERADLVLAGCAILEAVRRQWPCERLRVADRGLREGILYELMYSDGVLRLNNRRKPYFGGRKSQQRNRGGHKGGKPQPQKPA